MCIKKDLKKISKIIYIVAIAVVITGLGFFAAYYYFIKAAPDFEDKTLNYLKSLSSKEIRPGDKIELELSYFNHGKRDAKNLHIEFLIPANTKNAAENKSLKFLPEENKLVFETAMVEKNEGGKIPIILLADNPLDNETEIKIAGTEMSYEVRDEQKSVILGEEMVFRIKSAPKMNISKIVQKDKNGGDLRIGDILNTGFKVSNSGDMNAKEVIIEAIFPQKAEILESSINPKDYEIKDNIIFWKINNFKTDSEMSFSYDIKILKGVEKDEILINQVSLKTGENKLSESAEAVVKLSPDLNNSNVTLADKNGEYLWAGDVIKSTVSIENTGDTYAENVVLTCPVPQNTSYISGSAKCDGAEIIESSGKEIIFKIKKVDINDKKEASLEFQVAAGMTQGGSIKTAFKLSEEDSTFELKQAEIGVKANFKVTILCIGDSLIARSNWPQILGSMLESAFPRSDYSIIASGVPQETASGGFHRFDSTVAGYNPHIIIIGYGTNDVGGGTDKFRYYLNGLVEKAKALNATVLLESLGYIDTSIEPAKASWPDYQKIIYNIGASNGVPVADLYTPLSRDPQRYVADWVHYTSEGSAVVAQTIFNYVLQYLDGYGMRK